MKLLTTLLLAASLINIVFAISTGKEEKVGSIPDVPVLEKYVAQQIHDSSVL